MVENRSCRAPTPIYVHESIGAAEILRSGNSLRRRAIALGYSPTACAGKSANVLHMTYVVHTERKRLAGSRWLTSGSRLRWHMCVTIMTIFIVRFDRDQRCFSLELPITMQACHAYPPHWELGDDRGLNLRGTVEPRVLA